MTFISAMLFALLGCGSMYPAGIYIFFPAGKCILGGECERLTIKSQPQEVNGGGEYEMAQKGIAKQRLAGAPTQANKKTLRC